MVVVRVGDRRLPRSVATAERLIIMREIVRSIKKCRIYIFMISFNYLISCEILVESCKAAAECATR